MRFAHFTGRQIARRRVRVQAGAFPFCALRPYLHTGMEKAGRIAPKNTARSVEERTNRRFFHYASRDKTARSSAQEDIILIYQLFTCILVW
jgi:hypothetical protein